MILARHIRLFSSERSEISSGVVIFKTAILPNEALTLTKSGNEKYFIKNPRNVNGQIKIGTDSPLESSENPDMTISTMRESLVKF